MKNKVLQFFLKHKKAEGVLLTAALLLAALILSLLSAIRVFRLPKTQTVPGDILFFAPAEPEDYSADENTVCRVEYVSAEGYVMAIDYSFEEWEALDRGEAKPGILYLAEDGTGAGFFSVPTEKQLRAAFRDRYATEEAGRLNLSLALFLASIALGMMTFLGRFFTTYEKIWFLSILLLASVFAILFPETDANGVSGVLIMALYLADTLFNILCELLISKQSKWNFLVSLLVELTEIAICLVLSYRFATMATTLFFWIPIDIASFVNWHRHPDRVESELTEVRRLRGWQELLILVGVAVWTLGVGYFLTTLDFGTDLFGGDRALEVAVCYLDACASAVGIANGLFIFFRIREQWIAWYICALLETAINVLSGQYVLLVLKAGYLTNTTYGYLRWTSYIRSREVPSGATEIPGAKSAETLLTKPQK